MGSTTQHRKATTHQDPMPAPIDSLVPVATRDAPVGKTLRTFQRLTRSIRKRREALAAWEAYATRYQQRVAQEIVPAEQEMLQLQTQLVWQFDALLQLTAKGERLGQRHRAKVKASLLMLLDTILAAKPDPELEALFDFHSDTTRAELRQAELRQAEMVIAENFGADTLQGHQARTAEELFRHASERAAQRHAVEEREREQGDRHGGKPHGHRPETGDKDGAQANGKANKAAERRAMSEKEASQSVREIYRRLASALHPDREMDLGDHARKTDLMKRANQAYTRNDLLELLELQIEIEQIDAEHLSRVPEKRIRHYNAVLNDQVKTLDAEIEELVQPFRMILGLSMQKLTIALVDKRVSAEVANIHGVVRSIQYDLRAIRDPRRRRALLDALPSARELDGFDEIDELAELIRSGAIYDNDLFDDEEPPQTKRKRRKRR